MSGHYASVEKHATGIPGFDVIAEGGLPQARVTLVAGTAGSAKTVFSAQFLACGIRLWDEPGVFVTFEDPSADLRQNPAARYAARSTAFWIRPPERS